MVMVTAKSQGPQRIQQPSRRGSSVSLELRAQRISAPEPEPEPYNPSSDPLVLGREIPGVDPSGFPAYSHVLLVA
jgi:hypothetical protein